MKSGRISGVGMIVTFIGVTLLAVIAFPRLSGLLSGAGSDIALFAGGVVALVVGLLRADLLVLVFPLLAPLSSVPAVGGPKLVGLVVLAAVFGGFIKSSSGRRAWALLPIALAGYLVFREWGDPFGKLGVASALYYSVLGLLGVSAATLNPPKAKAFLWAVAVASATFVMGGGVTSVEDDRSSVTFGVNANGVGMVGAAGVLAVALLIVYSSSWRLRALAALLAVPCAYLLVVSTSQGAWLGLAVGLLSLLWWYRRGLAAVGMVLAAAATVAVDSSHILATITLGSRDAAVLANSREARASLYVEAWAQVRRSPLLGIGRSFNIDGLVSHSVYMGMLVLGGFVAVTLFVVTAAWVIIKCGTVADRRALLPLLVAFLGFGVSNEWFWYPVALIPMAALGIIMSRPRERRRGAASSHASLQDRRQVDDRGFNWSRQAVPPSGVRPSPSPVTP